MFSLIFSIFLVIIMTGTGYSIIKTVRPSAITFVERFLFSLGLGFGLFGFVIFIAGLLGLVDPRFYLVLILAGSALTIANIDLFHDLFGGFKGLVDLCRKGGLALFLCIAILVFIAINIFITMAPIYSIDAAAYHFALQKYYLMVGKIPDVEGYFYSHIPQLAEMTNLLSLSFDLEAAGALMTVYFGILCLFAAYEIGKRFFDPRVVLLGTALFYTAPMTTWGSTRAFIELPLAYFCLLSFLCSILYFERMKKRYILLSGLFLGLGFSIKPFAFNYFIMISLYMLYKFLGRSDLRGRVVRMYSLWLGAVVIFGSPWYIFNFAATGNPFFPLFYTAFGGKGWNEGTDLAFVESMNSYGAGRSLKDLILLPVNLTLKGKDFFQGYFVGPLALFLSPFAFFEPKELWKRVRFTSLIFIYLVIWFYGTQQSRFLIPVLPLAFFLVGSGAAILLGRSSGLVRKAAFIVIALSIVSSLRISVFDAARVSKVVLGIESRQEFLEKMDFDYVPIQWMNRNLKPSDKVLFYGFGPYHMEIPYMIGGYGLQGVFDYSAFGPETLDRFHNKLKEQGITHVYRMDDFAYMWEIPWWDAYVRKYLIKIYEDKRRILSKNYYGAGGIEVRGFVYRLK